MLITSLCVTRLPQTIVLHVSKCILDWENVIQSTVKDFLLWKLMSILALFWGESTTYVLVDAYIVDNTLQIIIIPMTVLFSYKGEVMYAKSREKCRCNHGYAYDCHWHPFWHYWTLIPSTNFFTIFSPFVSLGNVCHPFKLKDIVAYRCIISFNSRSSLDVSKKWGMLALVNHLFKIYFKVSDGLALFMYMYVSSGHRISISHACKEWHAGKCRTYLASY